MTLETRLADSMAAIGTETKSIRTLISAGSALPEPGQAGMLGWTYDPATAVGSSAAVPTSGTLYGARLWLPVAASVTNIIMQVGAIGATLTTGQSFAALYNAAGTLIGVTADQSTAWTTTGSKTMPLVGGPFSLAAGYYDVCFWSVGTTPPKFVCSASGSFVNMGLSGSASRFFTAQTGLTTSAPTPRGTKAASTISICAGVS